MSGYEIPVNETAYAAKERYLKDKIQNENKRKLNEEYTEFIKNSRDYFLSEAINMILQKSLNEDTSLEDREYGKALVEGFVQENGSIKLLREFSKKSLLLANIASIVNEAYQQVLHSCKEGDSKTFRITKTVDSQFFDRLMNCSDEKINEKINQRVCDSIEDYVQANVNDRLDLDELADKTKEKIENIKAKTADERDKIVAEFTNQYNKQVKDIKSRKNRKVGIYEQLLYSASQGIVRDKTVLESFMNESGSLNVSKIRDKVTVMYTFLEMLNTTKMANINESYIEKVIKNM